jgi:hypothetical protein
MLRIDIPQDAIISIGVAAYRNEGELTFGKLLSFPSANNAPGARPGAKSPSVDPPLPPGFRRDKGGDHSP